jgi:mannose-6-phosphate isomerase-like protein (cupin superfamily)
MSFIPSDYDRGYNAATADLVEESATRNWGQWSVLSKGPFYKVKKLIIHPGCSISNQYHNHRTETWFIIQGRGQAFIDDDIEVLSIGSIITIEPKSVHKVLNLSEEEDLIAIEVQTGEVCEEDDIVRI